MKKVHLIYRKQLFLLFIVYTNFYNLFIFKPLRRNKILFIVSAFLHYFWLKV